FISLLLRPALRAELRAFRVGAAVLALRFALDGRAAFGAELRAVELRSAVCARRDDGFFEALGRDVACGLGDLARLVDGRLALRDGVLGVEVRRVVLAESSLMIPAYIIYPFAATLALPEIRLHLGDGALEGCVLGLLVRGRLRVLAHTGGRVEQSPEDAAGRIQHIADAGRRIRLECSLVTVP